MRASLEPRRALLSGCFGQPGIETHSSFLRDFWNLGRVSCISPRCRFQLAALAGDVPDAAAAAPQRVRSGWCGFVKWQTERLGSNAPSMQELGAMWRELSVQEQRQYANVFVARRDEHALGAPPPLPHAQTPWGLGDSDRPLSPEVTPDLPSRIPQLDALWKDLTASPVQATAEIPVPDAPPRFCCKAAPACLLGGPGVFITGQQGTQARSCSLSFGISNFTDVFSQA